MYVTLVPVSENDAHELINIQEASFKRLYDIYQDERSPYLKGIPEYMKWLDMQGVSYFKIYSNNVLCGGIAYYKRSEGEYYLARVYVHPDYQCQGIAVIAISQCEKIFTDAKRYTLDFPIDQIANKMCYEKAGYHDTGDREIINDKLTLAIYEKVCTQQV